MPTRSKRVKENRAVYRAKGSASAGKSAKPKFLKTDHPYIVLKPNRRNKMQAVIRNTDVSVWDVAMYWKYCELPEKVAQALPGVPLAALYDAMSYYLDHRDEIHALVEETGEKHRTELMKKFPAEARRERILSYAGSWADLPASTLETLKESLVNRAEFFAGRGNS